MVIPAVTRDQVSHNVAKRAKDLGVRIFVTMPLPILSDKADGYGLAKLAFGERVK